jgi:hypothetical protein
VVRVTVDPWANLWLAILTAHGEVLPLEATWRAVGRSVAAVYDNSGALLLERLGFPNEYVFPVDAWDAMSFNGAAPTAMRQDAPALHSDHRKRIEASAPIPDMASTVVLAGRALNQEAERVEAAAMVCVRMTWLERVIAWIRATARRHGEIGATPYSRRAEELVKERRLIRFPDNDANYALEPSPDEPEKMEDALAALCPPALRTVLSPYTASPPARCSDERAP